MEILKSASKIVFVLMTLATIGALFTDKVTGEQFLLLAGMAFSFYFSNKGEATQPFAGK
jgi:hypothetical protein